jgi:hypothetical protein
MFYIKYSKHTLNLSFEQAEQVELMVKMESPPSTGNAERVACVNLWSIRIMVASSTKL